MGRDTSTPGEGYTNVGQRPDSAPMFMRHFRGLNIS